MDMRYLAMLLGVLFIISGCSLIINPELLLGWMEGNLESKGLYIGAIIGRILIGGLLIYTASMSRFPIFMKTIGGIAIIAGIVFVLIGHARFQSMLNYIFDQLDGFNWAGGLASILIGGVILLGYRAK